MHTNPYHHDYADDIVILTSSWTATRRVQFTGKGLIDRTANESIHLLRIFRVLLIWTRQVSRSRMRQPSGVSIRLLVEEATNCKLRSELRHLNIHSYRLYQEVEWGSTQLSWTKMNHMTTFTFIAYNQPTVDVAADKRLTTGWRWTLSINLWTKTLYQFGLLDSDSKQNKRDKTYDNVHLFARPGVWSVLYNGEGATIGTSYP